ncbi:MAG: hypothetical protein ACOZNI_06595 [Myxococcota bacterium]
MILLALGCTQCNCLDKKDGGVGIEVGELPGEDGDEIVAVVEPVRVAGDWATEDAGAVLELRLGDNLPRHVVLPGGVLEPQRVSLGARTGDVAVEGVAGEAEARVSFEVDPAAATTPVIAPIDDAWWNDVPLLAYEDGGLWTWVFTDEDGGTGLIPTLLMASYGRPVDVEGLWDGEDIQTTDHAWVPFEGPWEGEHPLLEVVTYNGLVGPLDGAAFHLSPVAVEFDDEGIREEVLDLAPWVLAAAFAEAEREDLVVEDGGQEDRMLGAAGDYVFLDYRLQGDGKVAFEVEVAGEWWSSTNGLPTSGVTDARVSGSGRTCVELPGGFDPEDVDAVRVRSYETSGEVVTARWFRYDDAFEPVELGAAEGVAFDAGATAEL